MKNSENITNNQNPEFSISFLEHGKPQAVHGQAELFISEEFTKNALTICSQSILKADESILTWLADTVHNIRHGNYDTILPNDLSKIKHGAVLVSDDLNDGAQSWIIVADKDATDADRRNYVIHVSMTNFIETLIVLFSKPITTKQLEDIDSSIKCFSEPITSKQMQNTPSTKLSSLSAIAADLATIARQNADPTIPFENRLDGNRDLRTTPDAALV